MDPDAFSYSNTLLSMSAGVFIAISLVAIVVCAILYLAPFQKILSTIADFLNNTLQKRNLNNSSISQEEISQVLELAADADANPEQNNIIRGIINFGNQDAEDVMTSRMDMVTLDEDSSLEQVIECIVTHEYSRIPVLINNSTDNIKGILYSKDLIPYLAKNEPFDWQDLIRQPFFVAETIKLDELLEEFQQNKIHFALVVDEFGGTSGIVTMEDVLEEVFGEIDDEYDQEEELLYRQIGEDSYIFEAKIELEQFLAITQLNEEIFEDKTTDIETLAGLILELNGDLPELNEIIKFKEYSFKVIAIDEHRILQIKFTKEEI